MRISEFCYICIISFALIGAECRSTTFFPEQAHNWHADTPKSASSQLKSEHTSATNLVSRTWNVRYQVVDRMLWTCIHPIPLLETASMPPYYFGPQVWNMLWQTVQTNYDIVQNQDYFALRYGQFILFFAAEAGHRIPLDFFDRFCSTMMLWATRGFFTLFDVVLQEMATGDKITVKLRLYGQPLNRELGA